MSFWVVFQILFTSLLIFYFYIRKKYSYWSSRGVPGPRPIFPFGYSLNRAGSDPFDLETSWVRKYGKLYGVYTGLQPTLILADPEHVKQVFIKDFNLFANRRILNSYHPVWNRNLFHAEYDQWKVYRSMTTPAFSSVKLRAMNPLIRSCINKLFTKLDSIPSGTFVPRRIFTNFSVDLTTAIFFATEIDAHQINERGEQNPVVRQCLALADIPIFKPAAIGALPRPILNLLGITSVFREDAMRYIVNLLKSIVDQQRKLPEASQNDFIRLLLGGTGVDGKPMTEDEIISQCLVYFSASYEQIASLMTCVVYEMAVNPDIQQRILEETHKAVDEIDEANWNSRYEAIVNDVPYLEAVINESLRKYPAELRMERRVSSPKGAQIGSLFVEKDTLIEIPTIAFHHNPEFFPNPKCFDPERFMPENKHLLVPYSFIPFGVGPKNCIGNRFSYQVAKLCLASLLMEYQIEAMPDTPKKLRFVNGNQSLMMPEFSLLAKKR